ncbi:MAG: chemotaxis-specific protein-glutamate methyltransferase CheB [Candidatus Rokubacteria bacterium]|nr:chemotaxis-specific protein-glutamate methyltransferase CheB [Candidatus Rokubacteria bacterium]
MSAEIAPIRVVLAEDSPVTREYLAHLLRESGAFEVVGIVGDGGAAVEATQRLRPDVVLMDIHMPRMNGYEATRRIMERTPTPIVLISASLDRDEVGMSFEALRAGALTVLGKPVGLGHPEAAATVEQMVSTLRLMAEVKVVRRWPAAPAPAPPPAPVPVLPMRRARLVAIGASTGGPAVLAEILGRLPAGLAAPVLVVQHIAPGFVGGLGEWLGGQTPLAVRVAQAGEPLNAATVYIAPDGHQMGVTRDGRISLVNDAAADGFRPSATYLFESVARAMPLLSVGVLLSGMGRDGAAGLRALRDAGGLTIAQDRETSVIFGMPAEAVRLGAAAYVLPPEEIAALIAHLARAK